jgi:prepilin signal peptidase PulO-like enzyme (type II secretory pathway)
MIYLILVLLGLCFGSFVNALVWRLHEQDTKKTKNNRLSILRGRSMCPSCKHELKAVDLLPVVSWISLGGKCRYCKKLISWQYPVVELLAGVIFVVSYVFWPNDFGSIGIFQFCMWLVFVIGFMALAVYDLKWMILPNRIIYPMIALGGIYVMISCLILGSTLPLSQAFYGVLISSGLFYGLFQVSSGKWIGGGDVKLGIIIGLIIGGLTQSLLVLFIGSLLGSLVSIPLLLSGAGRKKKIPFGPFLIMATIIVFLFGTSITTWYQNTFFLM